MNVLHERPLAHKNGIFDQQPETSIPAEDGIFASLQPVSSPPFSLTYRVVMCKQHSAVFPNQVSSFNPRGKEDLKWSTVARKPRYSEQMEIGVLYFVAPEKAQRE